ncbi:hypothetical protein ASE00_05595 [Sphingomonas sp. Root710]|nr:hypothetical protein ASE00_05595 [Sphingomonas sp. Root710]
MKTLEFAMKIAPCFAISNSAFKVNKTLLSAPMFVRRSKQAFLLRQLVPDAWQAVLYMISVV